MICPKSEHSVIYSLDFRQQFSSNNGTKSFGFWHYSSSNKNCYRTVTTCPNSELVRIFAFHCSGKNRKIHSDFSKWVHISLCITFVDF